MPIYPPLRLRTLRTAERFKPDSISKTRRRFSFRGYIRGGNFVSNGGRLRKSVAVIVILKLVVEGIPFTTVGRKYRLFHAEIVKKPWVTYHFSQGGGIFE